MTELFNNQNIKHLKLILICVAMFVTIVSIMTIQRTAIAAGDDYKSAQRAEIESKIRLYADKYNVSFQKMYNTVDKETNGTFNPIIQSQVKYDFSSAKRGIVQGTQEMSYGLAQIHLPDHKNISYEQATDIDFSLDFMAHEYSLGHCIWYAVCK